MKRDPHLHDLSRDHHHALVLARQAERAALSGSDADVAAIWASVSVAFEAELNPHFIVEEQHLLSALEGAGEEALTARTRAEHARLRALNGGADNARDRLAKFGALLRQHVRFEERELFPLAEELLSIEALQAVAEASAATMAATQRAKVRASKGQL